jgi:hypothetical protein
LGRFNFYANNGGVKAPVHGNHQGGEQRKPSFLPVPECPNPGGILFAKSKNPAKKREKRILKAKI